MENASQPKTFSWRLFWLLLGLGILGVLAIIPMAIELFGKVVQTAEAPPIPLPALILIGAVQNLSLLAAVIFVGLKLGQKLGLGAPLLGGWLVGNSLKSQWGTSLKEGLIIGLGVGVLLLILLLAVVPLLPNLPFVAAARLAVWKRFLACFYGGFYEEIFTRLFLLSLIAWLASKALRKPLVPLAPAAFWIANLMVAVLFGLGHLPSASLVMPITPLVVAVALTFNGIAGVAFGILYRKRGLEAAMIAHFTADFVIYVVGSAFLAT
jgi:membrane protease YdiL (CAAX protease family)